MTQPAPADTPTPGAAPAPEGDPTLEEAASAEASAPASTPSGKGSGLGRSSIVMAAGTAVSRLGGLVRNLLLVAAVGGVGTVADAFDVANKLPNVMFAILAGGALNAVLVPQIVKAYRSENTQERLDKLLTLSGVGILALTTLLTAASSLIVTLYAPGFSPDQRVLATIFAFWCIPQLFFYGLYTLLGQVLNARGQFGPFMWAPVLNNVVSILGFGVFVLVFGTAPGGRLDDLGSWDTPRTLLLAGTATLGIAAQALVLIVPLWRSGFRWRFRLGVRGIGLRSAGSVAGWTFAAVILEQLSTLYLTRVASRPDALAEAVGRVDVAGNMAYTQALMIYLLPHSLVTVSIATALFTSLSKAAAEGRTDQVRDDLSLGVRTVGVFTVFATAAMVALATPVTALIVPTAGEAGVRAIAPVLVALSLGLVPLGAMVLMKWVYFAYEDGRSIFWITLASSATLVVVLFAAVQTLSYTQWVLAGGAAYALSNWVTVLLRTGGLRAKLGGRLDAGNILRLHIRAGLAAALSGAAAYGLYRLVGGHDALVWDRSWVLTMLSGLWVTALCGLVMLAVYVGLLKLLRVRELDMLAKPLLRRLGR